jgi:hypothetical protein
MDQYIVSNTDQLFDHHAPMMTLETSISSLFQVP